MQVTGDPGKMVAVLRNLTKFGVKELARTGKVKFLEFQCYSNLCMQESLYTYKLHYSRSSLIQLDIAATGFDNF